MHNCMLLDALKTLLLTYIVSRFVFREEVDEVQFLFSLLAMVVIFKIAVHLMVILTVFILLPLELLQNFEEHLLTPSLVVQ